MKKLAVANGQYQNSVGETKTRWVNVGVMGVSSNGKEFMLIDPIINFAGFPREEGKDMVMVGMFEEQQNQQQNAQQQSNYNQPQQQQQYGSNAPVQYTDQNGNPIPQ